MVWDGQECGLGSQDSISNNGVAKLSPHRSTAILCDLSFAYFIVAVTVLHLLHSSGEIALFSFVNSCCGFSLL